MGLTINLIGIAIILVVGFVFYSEISDGVSGLLADRELQSQNDALDIRGDQNTLATCDLVMTIKGELEHDLFAGFFESAGLNVELTFEFGENTFFPQVAEWQFTNCQGGNLQIASFIPRLQTNVLILQESGVINEDDTGLTTNQLVTLDITGEQEATLSGNQEEVAQQLFDLNLSVGDLQTNDVLALWDETYLMKLKVRSLDGVSFRECNSFNPELCKDIIFKAGLVQTPQTFEKTFLIKNLPLEEYNVEIVIEGQKINDLEPNQPFIYNVRFN